MKRLRRIASILGGLLFAAIMARGQPVELCTGTAGHAFDHLGEIADQAETAAASGATIIYSSGVGAGYLGLPKPDALAQRKKAAQDYAKDAKRHGIRLVIDYICATSIVNLDAFDQNWTPEFRARFRTPPSAWLQQDRNGKALPSWYGGQYQPACMSNADWREYERSMVRLQLEAGADGIFFDNPTVHAQGCYCPACMKEFFRFLEARGDAPRLDSTVALRDWADKHPTEFLEFRGTIARDFLAEMRSYARTIKPKALISANNSLNSPNVFFSQCRSLAYNIYEMSRAQDFVVLEDMSTLARTLPDGRVFEYSPVYRLVHSICHDKPVVAVTLADADYTTPPNLARLAAAEAAANDASSLLWPTWPLGQRSRMSSRIRPELDFLRKNVGLFQGARPRADVVLFLPFRQWLVTEQCRALSLSVALTRANIPFDVICEDGLRSERWTNGPHEPKVLLAESPATFTPDENRAVDSFRQAGGVVIFAEKADWLSTVQAALGKPSIVVRGPETVRAIVRDQRRRTVVHLLNLNVEKIDSFQDKPFEVSGLGISVRIPFAKVHSVRALTADADATSGALMFSTRRIGEESRIDVTIPRLDISTILVIE